MLRMLIGLLAAFALSALLGPTMIKLLRKLHVGQNIYELAPESHKKKQGTPTMGGLLFALVTTAVALVLHQGGFSRTADLALPAIVFSLLNLCIGFADDFTKKRGGKNQGLTELQKLALQIVLAAAFSVYCFLNPQVGSSIYVPFLRREWDLGWVYVPVMMFVIICTANGSNLLDGLDGLCGGVSAVVMGAFALMTLICSCLFPNVAGFESLGTLCACACGALLGYLCYNFHPAKVMMGDTGSMYLGGLVVSTAMLMRLPLLIPLAAGAMAASLLSVFMQRYYFKLTHGKRIFKMSPLHHHFEKCGVEETRIVSMYVLVTVLLCALALAGIVIL